LLVLVIGGGGWWWHPLLINAQLTNCNVAWFGRGRFTWHDVAQAGWRDKKIKIWGKISYSRSSAFSRWVISLLLLLFVVVVCGARIVMCSRSFGRSGFSGFRWVSSRVLDYVLWSYYCKGWDVRWEIFGSLILF